MSVLSIIGFIPTEKGYVHKQPNIVIYYIKIVFAVIPIILSLISFVYKTKYPINEDYNSLIKKGIEIQKKNFDLMKRNKINYYKIKDPVYKVEHINIIPNTNKNLNDSILTKDLCDHFNSKNDLILIYNGNLESLKKKLMEKIIIGIFLCFLFFSIILYSFKLLANEKYSFIPIGDAFILTFMIILVIFWILKIIAVNKVIEKKYNLDKKLVKLFIFYKRINNHISE